MVAFRLCGSSGGAKELDSRQILKMEPKVFALRLKWMWKEEEEEEERDTDTFDFGPEQLEW